MVVSWVLQEGVELPMAHEMQRHLSNSLRYVLTLLPYQLTYEALLSYKAVLHIKYGSHDEKN